MNKRSSIIIIIILICVICGLLTISGRAACVGGGKSKAKTGSSSNDNTFIINAPSNLSATAVSFTQINLSWFDNSNNEDGFGIESREGEIGVYTQIATVSADTNSYLDTRSFSLFTTYYYRVRSFNTIGDYSAYSNEVSITTISPNWAEVVAGESHTIARATDGSIWGWGNNLYGQLGLGYAAVFTTTPPTQIGTNTDWFSVACGYWHTLAIKTNLPDGQAGSTLWTWGVGESGQLGLGDTEGRVEPEQVSPPQAGDWVQVTGGANHSIGLKTDRSIWSWGWNDYGQLGLGDSGTGTDRYTPTLIDTDFDWSIVAAGSAFSFGIKTNGTMWSWGLNNSFYGTLGINSTTDRNTPTQVGTGSDWSVVAPGYVHAIALKTDKTLWAWGQNYQRYPGSIGTDSDWQAIAVGDGDEVSGFSLALKTNGTLWSWGYNQYGQLGLGNTNNRTIPTAIGIDSGWAKISAGNYHSTGLKNNGAFYLWGRNDYAQLGFGDTIDRNVPCLFGSTRAPTHL